MNLILFGIFFFFLVVAVAGIILRLACSVVGIDPAPDLGRAMMIVLGNCLALMVIGFLLGMVGLGGAPSGLVSALVSAKVYEVMLPTSFGRGFLIWLAQFVIIAILAFGMSILMGGMLAGLMMAHH